MSKSARVGWRGAAALLIAPLAWALHHQIGSNTAFAACEHEPARLALLIGAGACASIVVAAMLAWRAWRDAGGTWKVNAESLATFVPLLSLMACAAFGLPVLAQLMADVIVPTCVG